MKHLGYSSSTLILACSSDGVVGENEFSTLHGVSKRSAVPAHLPARPSDLNTRLLSTFLPTNLDPMIATLWAPLESFELGKRIKRTPSLTF